MNYVVYEYLVDGNRCYDWLQTKVVSSAHVRKKRHITWSKMHTTWSYNMVI